MMGVNHFMKTESMVGYAQSKGVSSAKSMVLFSGLLIFLGGLGFILGIAIKWAIILIAVFLIAVSFKMHAFWKIEDPQEKMAEMSNFMKNMALLGAALMMWMFSTGWPLAL